jgi:hypothetical protein
MRRRTPRGILATALIVLLTVGVVALWPHTDPGFRITRRHSDRIHKGMTRSRAEAVVRPSGSYLAD